MSQAPKTISPSKIWEGTFSLWLPTHRKRRLVIYSLSIHFGNEKSFNVWNVPKPSMDRLAHSFVHSQKEFFL
jgi:hypothetical protein